MKTTQSDKGLGFDGAEAGVVSYKQNKKYAYNQHTGVENEGKLIDKGIGPRKGNSDTTTHAGPKQASATVKESFGNPDSINVGRGPRGGGAEVKPMKENYGRGPTKGNQQ